MKLLAHIGLLVFACTFFSPLNVEALTVSPVRMEITADPGQTVTGKLLLLNEQDGTKTFYSSFENFEPSGDSGAPRFIGAGDGLATWMEIDSKVTLESGKSIDIPYSITIPQNAEPGGYFAAIFFGSQAPGVQGGGEVSIGGKIGVLILLRVSGEVAEGGGLLEFITKEKNRFFSTLPISFFYRLNNTGGDRIVPSGEIKIKNIFQITSATLLANKNEGSVLPGSIRKFEVIWGNKLPTTNNKEELDSGFFAMAGRQWKEFHFGWYTARISLVWGDTNQTANASYNFFIIPWQLLSIALIILIILWFVLRAGLKRYNRYIIAQATQQLK